MKTDAEALALFRAVGEASQHERRTRDAAAGDGYGCCPKCLKINPPDSSRERAPNGNTKCGACGATAPSHDWPSAAQGEHKAAQQRAALARVALVDAAMEAS